jgi:phosphoserine aminotransferase
VMEMSHRSASFTEVLENAERDIRELLGVGDGHHVVFLQGGASLQFLMVPMNFLPEGGVADYIVTGKWSEGAVKQAKRFGNANEAASSKADNYSRLPSAHETSLSAGAAYVHFTSNNTIAGTQWSVEPEVGDRPLVCDASSDFMCRPLDVGRYGLIYAGAQKNAGPAGVTIVIVSDELLKTRKSDLPELLHLSDRIVVLRRGRRCGEVDPARAGEADIVALAAGVDDADRSRALPG